jgi:hypothetical protein
MTTKEFIFNKNKFMSEIFDNMAFTEYVGEQVNVLTNPNNRKKDGQVSGYRGPTTEEELAKSVKLNPDRSEIMPAIYELYKNPKSQSATDFVNCWKFVGPVVDTDRKKPYKQDVLLVLNKVNIFDEDVQVRFLNLIADELYRNGYNIPHDEAMKIYKDVLIMIASNPKATLQNKSTAANRLGDIDIARDTIEMAKKELQTELKKDFPDQSKISLICGNAKNAVESLSVDYHKYKDAVVAEFNLDNILALGVKYVPTLQKSLEERNAELETDKINSETKIKQKDDEIARAKKETENVQYYLDQERQKTEKLTQQLNEMQRKIHEQEFLIKSIKIKIGSQKVGLIGGGPLKEIQEYIKTAAKEY